jgi:glutamate-1-semialdehyde 2,1-aminomutase
MKISKSIKYTNLARKIIPHQTGTFSRSASHFVEGVYPSYIQKAKGAYFEDVDGNNFLDYLLGLGPITLGYNYERVNNAIKEQLDQGILFSLPHHVEVDTAELILKIIPNAEMIKFEKTGSNVVTGAVRAARAITKRDKIAYCGSGGVWHDWQAAMVSRDDGVPKFNSELIKIFEYNDIEGLEQIFENNKDEIAAIVMEPTVYEQPKNGFLKKVRKIVDKNNSLLIFDEIITGFRFDLHGGQKMFNVKADLVCFGKGMGNGLPIAAITGPTEFMKIFDNLWVSSTNNSEALSLAGTKAVIMEMEEKKSIDHCWNVGQQLLDGWNKISIENDLDVKMSGYPVRMLMTCNNSKGKPSTSFKALVLQEMVKKGIFMSPSVIFNSYSHSSKDIEKTLDVYDEVCKLINQKIVNDNFEKHLEGKLPTTVWTMKIQPTKKL